jgi:hypothetical protein
LPGRRTSPGAARGEGGTILVAARDEEERIGATIARLRAQFPDWPVVVGDDGSRDRTAAVARAAGAEVVRGPRLGKGEALNAAERHAAPGPLLLCDADVEGDLRPLAGTRWDLAVAVFAERVGGGFGIAKRTARRLIRARTGFEAAEPLSGQRFLTERARAACFPLARGFGCELRMTVDALDGGLAVGEVVLPLAHRATVRDAPGFAHRGRQLVDAVLAAGPLKVNHRGNRIPVLGPLVALPGIGAGTGPTIATVAALGLADDLWSGPERGFAAHLGSMRTTGVLKLVAIPTAGLLATGSASGALAVGLAANALNQLDTKPGRALKAYLVAAALVRGPIVARYAPVAVLLCPYDLRERGMLGDAGSNALGAVVGLALVARLTERGRWTAVGLLAGLNLLGERVSLGRAIERLPVLAAIDGAGRIDR